MTFLPTSNDIMAQQLREHLELLQEENRLLKAALSPQPTRLIELRDTFGVTNSEGKMLDCFINAKGHTVSRHRIASILYGLSAAPKDGEGDQRTVDVLLAKLRAKLRQFNSTLEIQTLWGSGWRLDPTHRSLILAALGKKPEDSRNLNC